MTINRSTNLDEILGLEAELSSPDRDNHVELFEDTERLITSDAPPEKQKWADNIKVRLAVSAGIAGVLVIVFMTFYGNAFELKKALKNSRSQTVAEASDLPEAETDTELVETENLRGAIAIGEQKKAIESIEGREANPKIELEAIDTAETPQSLPVQAEPINRPPAPKPVRRYSAANYQPTVKARIQSQVKEVKYDSMDTWQALSLLGSYGNKVDRTSQTQIESVASRMNKEVSKTDRETLPPLLAVHHSSATKLTNAEAAFLEALESAKTPQKQKVKLNTVAQAQQIKGKLTTPINWVAEMNTPKQRTFIRLEEPLLDNKGEVQIPEGTLIVFEVEKIDGGVIFGEAVASIQDNQEISLPKGAVSILDKKGNMLTANYQTIKNGSGNFDLLNFALGAVRQTSDLIAQPDSSFSQVSGLGQTQSTTFENKNYPGAIVSGGVEQILENRTQELERRNGAAPISSFWQLKANTSVTIQTNYSFEI